MRTITYDEKTHRLVPLEPTEEMIQAAVDVGPAHAGRRNLGQQLAAEYKAAVTAAPK